MVGRITVHYFIHNISDEKIGINKKVELGFYKWEKY